MTTLTNTMEDYMVRLQAEGQVEHYLDGLLLDRGILRSQEILDMVSLAAVPCNGLRVKGVLNTQGGSIPLIDLRIKLDVPLPGQSESASVVIVAIAGNRFGFIVEAPAEA